MKTKKPKLNLLPFFFLFPMVVIIIGLVYYPVARTIGFSFSAMDLLKPQEKGFVFLENFKSILGSSTIWLSLSNTLFVLVLVLIGTLVLGIIFALVLNRKSKIEGLLLAITILPWALPPVVNGILWRGIFHPKFGIINKLLLSLGLIKTEIQWLTQPYLVLTIAALVVLWRVVPLAAMIFLSAMRAIPDELYESAHMDGCNSRSAFRFITLPIISPTMAIVLTLTSVTAIGLFDEVVSLTGFSGQTRTALIEAYMRLFTYLNFGEGSAFVVLIMILTAIPTYFYIKHLNSQVEYI